MNGPIADSDRFWALLNVACDNDLNDAQRRELEALLDSDPAARKLFVQHVQLRTDIQFLHRSEHACDGGLARVQASLAPSIPPTTPAIVLGFPAETPRFSMGYFAESLPFAYLVAAVLVGLGMFIGSLVHVSSHERIAGMPQVPELSNAMANVVARITGTSDCRWERKGVASGGWRVVSKEQGRDSGLGASESYLTTNHKPLATSRLVSLGDQFILSAGLMEITYNTGARVILQGPCTFEVDSAAGGFLTIGKLTARIGERGERRGNREGPRSKVQGSRQENLQIPKSPNPSSSPQPLAPSPLFTVRTPTATVTDLGTEFGVEVAADGATRIHVLEGIVETRTANSSGKTIALQRVTEGHAVEIKAKDETIAQASFAPRSFARDLDAASPPADESAYIQAVLGDRPMGYWPLNEPARSRRCFDRSGNEVHGYVMKDVSTGQRGPFSEGSRAYAFDGDGYVDFGVQDRFAMPSDFTVEAWVWIGKVEQTSFVISALGREGDRNIGWGLIAGHDHPEAKTSAENPLVLYFIVQPSERFYFPLAEGESLENAWHHVAVAFDGSNTAHLYLDGALRGSVAHEKPSTKGRVWLQIGCAEQLATDFWRGRLAHVAVYPRALSEQQIQNHFNQRKRLE